MIYQNSIDKVHQDFNLDWMDAARLRTVVKGKTMPPLSFRNRKTRATTRKMSASYYVEKLVSDSLKGVKPDADSLRWMAEQQKKAISRRKKQDEKVRNGANRKPKSQWKKPGRIAGKHYPKYEAAMKLVAAKKRAAAEARKQEKLK